MVTRVDEAQCIVDMLGVLLSEHHFSRFDFLLS